MTKRSRSQLLFEDIAAEVMIAGCRPDRSAVAVNRAIALFLVCAAPGMAGLFMEILAHVLQRERVRHKGNTAGNF